MPILPLVGTQLGIWLADQVGDRGNAYVIAHAVALDGPVCAETLARAVRQGLGEADTVTARFFADETGAVQALRDRPEDAPEIPLERVDLSRSADPEAAARALMQDDVAADLPAAGPRPLCRQVLMTLGTGVPRWLWYQRFHHLMLDGVSFTALTRRIAQIYTALLAGRDPGPSPFAPAETVVAAHEAYAASPAAARDRAFWRAYCRDLPPACDLSVRAAPPEPAAARIVARTCTLPDATRGALAVAAAAAEVAVLDLLVAAVAAYLARMCGRPAQVLGMPFMRRLGSAAAAAAAPLVTVLPVRVVADPALTLVALARQVKAALAEVRRHQRCDAEQIQRDLGYVGSGRALYGPVVNVRLFDYDLAFGAVPGVTHHVATGPVDDLEFGLRIGDGRVTLELRADGGRYDADDLAAHGRRLACLLAGFQADPARPVGALPVMDAQELDRVRRWSSGPDVRPLPGIATIIDLFARNAASDPEAVALVAGGARLTFRTLAGRVFRLARALAAEGIGPGDVVAVALPRGADQVVALLGVLASGAACLPLDLDHPDARLAAMCADARPVRCLAGHAAGTRALGTVPLMMLDDPGVAAALAARSGAPLCPDERTRQLGPDDVAALIFTSGSTGRPKGVMTTHAALVNLLASHTEAIYGPGLDAVRQRHGGRRLRAAHTHSFAFDSSWLQLFWMVLGQELHVIDEHMRRDAEALADYIDAARIDALDLPPSFCAQLLGAGLTEPGRHAPTVLLIGGEAASPALWAALNAHPNLRAHNLYGPTEYTVDTLHAVVAESAVPLVGRPIGNTRAHVLDRRLQPVPVGAVGELYVTGAGLARGYCGQPARTAERFVADPFAEGGILYRTGDLARWTDDGRLVFLGRADHQVKIRGYRVEIPEVEAALTALPEVGNGVVVAEAVNDSHRLLAYCTLAEGPGSGDRDARAQDLREALRARLPDYMVPAVVTILDALPLTVNGKVDRARLPAPAPANAGAAPPATPEEACVARAMAQALNLPAVSAESDFFALGGDSISAIVLCNALRGDGFLLRPRDVFRGRDPRRMARALTRRDGAVDRPDGRAIVSAAERAALSARYGAIAEVLPVLPTQKGLLFHVERGDRAETYNAFTRIDIDGPLDAGRLARAFDAVMRRHPQLGGAFDTTRDEPVLLIPDLAAQAPLWPFARHDLSDLDEADLIRLAPERHVLIITVHHLMIDGWSTPLLLNDLLAAYETESDLPPLPVGYGAVVRGLAALDRDPSRAAWRAALAGVRPCRLFEHRPAAARVEEATATLSAAATRALTAEARRRGVTLNGLMQGVWAAVLGTLAGRDEVVFGTPVSGRAAEVPGLAAQVGLFLNTIPVRVALMAGAGLWRQVEALRDRHARLMEHDGLGLGEIQALAGAGPLFDTLLVVENYPDSAYRDRAFGGLRLRDICNRGYSHYPLALLVLPGDSLTLLLENRGAVDDAPAFVARVAALLETLAAEPDRPLHGLALAGPADRALMAAANATARPLPPLTLRDLLAAQAARTPDAVALEEAGLRLTFRDVRHQVRALAGRLRGAGVRPGDVVAVGLPRSGRLTLALLAVIEAGAAFLPLDLSYPDERLAFMLADAGPRLVVTDAAAGALAHGPVPALVFDGLADPDAEAGADLPDDGLSPAHPAYLLYTSGTTGQPKGALITHAAIVNRLLWMQHQYALGSGDAVLQKTPCGFDVAVWEFFWPLLAGGRLVMAPPEAHRDPEAIADLVARHTITTLHFVPSMLALFLDLLEVDAARLDGCGSLTTVFASGEALRTDLARRFAAALPGAALHNLYGPTEAAVDVTYAPAAGPAEDGAGGVPIGRPVWNTALRVLDHQLRPVPVGVAGELYLSGVQLAAGYLGRPGLTAERFVADPFADGQRLYRTGDLACWRPDGQLAYRGRTDHQIKIRGQRVELGEIEAQMARLPGIARAVAHAVDLTGGAGGADGRQIVGYVVPAPAAQVAPEAVRAALGAVLPGHMVPAAVVLLDDLPLSPNGKLDRKALPVPARQGDRRGGRAPADGLEARLAALFAELLGLDSVGVDDDFFAVGGYSLLAMRLAARIRRDLKRRVSVGQILMTPTVAKLAWHLAAGAAVDSLARSGFDPVVRLREGHGVPLICLYPGSGLSWQYNVLSRYLRGDRPILGLQSPRPDGPLAVSGSLDELCDRQLAILREVQPHGPYDLLGYSLGGTIAYGLAVRLRRMGEEVRFLGLLDTYPAEAHDWTDPGGIEAGLGAEREQEAFIADALGDVMDEDSHREKAELFGHIFANYRDAVALLSRARTEPFAGAVTLFVAEKSRLPHIDPERVWTGLVGRLAIHRLAHCSHEDILSPASLEILGPLIDTLLAAAGTGARRPPGAPPLPERRAG
jgi:L-arginine---[L-arginyl-carrier protein] ligase